MLYFYAAKILPIILMPLTISLLLLLAGLVLIRRPRLARFLLLVSFAVLWLSSTPLVAESVLGVLESRYPPRPDSELPTARCLVLLGGAVSPRLPPRTDIEIERGSDRVVKAAQLFKAGKAETIIVSAGNKPLSIYEDSGASEAELLSELLQAWGVPRPAVVLESDSKNTWENARNTTPLLEQWECGKPLLVTSAAHMPRAVGAFNTLRVEVIPVSVDIRVVAASRSAMEAVIPDAESLAETSDGVREWLGRAVYRLKGWN